LLLSIALIGPLAFACPASAQDAAPPPSSATDSQMRALSGSDNSRAADTGALRGLSRPDRDHDPASRASAAPLVRPDSADAAAVSRAVAAGNRTSQQLMTPEEDDAGSIGGSLLAIAGLVLGVVVVSRFVGSRS
jgi:hypothetical protein